MSTETAIETDELTKRYGSETALEDLSLTVERGEIYGFLGPNGAGKSTTIDLLMDYIRPTSGRRGVLGGDPATDGCEVRDRVGILPDAFSVYENRTARTHVELVVETKGTDDDPTDLLARVGLSDAIEQEAGTYSRGMRQRLALAMALVGEPDLLILDEPFRGLDPRGIRTIREIAHEENDRGATVFFSSHVLGQVELVCDRIGILHDGRLAAEGSLESLREQAPVGDMLQVSVAGSLSSGRTAANDLEGVERVTPDDGQLSIQLADGTSADIAIERLEKAGVTVVETTVKAPSMESIFLAHTDETVAPGEPR